MTPEELAGQNIDKQLQQAGWIIQDYKALNPSAGLGLAVREYPTDLGSADYILFIDRKPVGVIAAKKEGKTPTLTVNQNRRKNRNAIFRSRQSGISVR